MPPIIALILCIIFVTILIKFDHQSNNIHSVSIWIPILWFIRSASKPLNYFWGSNQKLYEDELTAAVMQGSPIDRIFFIILIFLGLIVLLKRKIDWWDFIQNNKWLVLLFLFMFISIFWSDYPYVSFKRWIRAFGVIIMSLIVLTSTSPEEQTLAILKRFVFIAIPFSVVLIKYFPQLGVNWGKWNGEPIWAGISTGKNSLGVICMFSGFIIIWTWIKKITHKEQTLGKFGALTHILLFIMILWLFKGPGGYISATSTVVFIVGISTLFLLINRKINAHIVFTTCLLLIIFGVTFPFLWRTFSESAPVTAITSLLGRDPTFTNRGDMIWDQLTPIVASSPFFGKGYGGFWINYLEFQKHYINEAHNGYLDILLQIGILGLFSFLLVIITFQNKMSLLLDKNIEWGSFLITFLLMSVLHNITESSFLVPTTLLWDFLVFFIIIFSRKHSFGQSLD